MLPSSQGPLDSLDARIGRCLMYWLYLDLPTPRPARLAALILGPLFGIPSLRVSIVVR